MESLPMGSRQRQALETKEKIFKVSIGLMRENGYHATKVETICQAAGISVGAFYHHFRSKEDILSFTYDEADKYFETEVAERLKKIKKENRILGFFRIYAEFNDAQGLDVTKVLYNGDNHWFIKSGRAMQAVLAIQIREAQEAGLVSSKVEATTISTELFVLARGIVYDWCIHEGHYNLVGMMEKLIGTMLQGYRA